MVWRELFVLVRLGRLLGGRLDDVFGEGVWQLEHVLESWTVPLRPVVQHGDAGLDPTFALGKPRYVDVEVLDPDGHASAGGVSGSAREHLILAIVEEPQFRVVVRFGRRHCDAKL